MKPTNNPDRNTVRVEIVIPVYNEEEELKKNILKLHYFLEGRNDFKWRITIADNASTDDTGRIGKKLAAEQPRIKYVYFKQKGRGRAVKAVWLASDADILTYMDIDLSTDINHLPHIIEKLRKEADIAIGSRLLADSVVHGRTFTREFVSRGLNVLIKLMFRTRFSDAQCGFKGITKKAARELIPVVEDNSWFMDSELLIIAEKAGYKIYEEPVVWSDNPGSTVRVLPTAWGDFKGLVRLLVKKPWKKLRTIDN